MTARRLHRLAGLVLLLPMFGWAATGALFFLKPGYDDAYSSLTVKTYPLDAPVAVKAPADWLEVRYLRTVLGPHLLARTATDWRQFDPVTLEPRPAPGEADVRALLREAISANPSRYGTIEAIEGTNATTTTGARLNLDWNQLSLSQRGRDTDRIDWFYKVHYLQWTGIAAIDDVLGLTGLVLIVVLSVLGARLLLRPMAVRRNREQSRSQGRPGDQTGLQRIDTD
jgi:hypothetical protein